MHVHTHIHKDDLLGFRHYRIIISTVLHELVHNRISEHNAEFHALNSQLNRVRLGRRKL